MLRKWYPKIIMIIMSILYIAKIVETGNKISNHDK